MPMPTAAEMIRALELKPHPEGGHYRETFRDARHVDGRPASTAMPAPGRLPKASARGRLPVARSRRDFPLMDSSLHPRVGNRDKWKPCITKKWEGECRDNEACRSARSSCARQ